MSRRSAWAAAGRAITTISMAGSPARLCRKLSRTTRLMRLRSTADLETFRETAMPSLASGPDPGRLTSVNSASVFRRPDLSTRRKSSGERSRYSRGNPNGRAASMAVSPGPSDGQLGPTLGAPAGENLSALLRGHAGTKPVGPLATQIAGLICALHFSCPVLAWRRPAFGPQKGTKSYACPDEVSTTGLRRGPVAGPVDKSVAPL